MTTFMVCVRAMEAWKSACIKIGLDHRASDRLLADVSNGFIPLGPFTETLENLADAAGSKALGWVAGELHEIRSFGPLGNALLCSPTLGAALGRLGDYFALVQDATEFLISHEDGHAVISYRILDPEIWPRHQDALFTLSIVGQMLRRAIGFDWKQVQIALECDDPAVTVAVRNHARIGCTGNAETNSLRFPVSFLNLPFPASGAVIPPDHRTLRRAITQKRQAMSVETRVRAEVYRHLGSPLLDQKRIAAELGMSPRTLRRKLAEEHSSFQEILYDCRMRQAAHHFRIHRSPSIADIAIRLGYSEHSAFTRAFSRWNGMPPRTFLQERRYVG